MNTSILTPGQAFPEINVSALNGNQVTLGQTNAPFEWKMVVVYRGKHCPLCTTYLKTLNQLVSRFNDLGVDVVTVSADSKERAESQLAEVESEGELNFTVGYGLAVEQIRQLGLLVSSPKAGMDVENPFSEPGLFVINEEGNVQVLDVSNVPFARPDLNSMLMGVRFIKSKSGEFPISGSY